MKNLNFKRKIVNVLSVLVLYMFLFSGCHNVQSSFESTVESDFNKQPLGEEKILRMADIKHMPSIVQKYLLYTGVIGKPQVQNIRIVFKELMYKNSKAQPLDSTSDQYNFFRYPSRHFFMKASMMGIPFRVLHSYSDEKATMLVRVASLFNAVDLAGENLSETETVTLLNDLCLFAPSALIQKNISWEKRDSLSVKVNFKNGKYNVSAILFFNQKGELVEFVSEDRSALQDDGSLRKVRWTTPVRDYREFHGVKVPTYGEAIWNYPEGDFTYGKFFLQKIEYNLKSFKKE
ncbi:hypothetical protein ND856_16355 [Leptospira bandrabouensis]|uniref:DUF6544 family protein n=1 Tax=Leptospira bandrabouensis TaxID=2484903 RepID=UPI00223DAB8D|nr:DUF6544 family protein [Leptospira bandrabouensis]MCW7458384.1 hypothetical protein [Leptospira bandrabouensis]MCW7478869.1 hypothetical protein [Leptospira bandrabouensis]MCW7486467.1 hypothetical protein [Leptospira bandrabouensis]